MLLQLSTRREQPRPGRTRRTWCLLGLAVPSLLTAFGAAAQTLNLDLGPGGGVTERALQLVALVTVLSLAP